MRLFIGIGLPSMAGEALAHAARNLLRPEHAGGARVHWTRPEDMHVTLSFLGEVAPSRLTQIQQDLEAIRAGRLRLKLDGLGVFSRAGILHAKLKSSAELFSLAEQVFLAMERCGFPREQRRYAPHVTLARFKGRMPTLSHGKDNPAFWRAFEAREFRLYQSFTRPGGSNYEVLSVFPLE